jgi:hypothetical protein
MLSGKRKNLLFKMIDEYVEDYYIRIVIKEKMLEILDYSGYKQRIEKQKEQKKLRNEVFNVFEKIKLSDIYEDKGDDIDDSEDEMELNPQGTKSHVVREIQFPGDPQMCV